jgi:hypothetical protein
MVPIQTFRAQEIVEDLEAALEQSREIAADRDSASRPPRSDQNQV